MWAAIHESCIREMHYFNKFRKFSPTKVPKYSIDEVSVRVTTPTYHAHEPLGMQILARTLLPAHQHQRVFIVHTPTLAGPHPCNT